MIEICAGGIDKRSPFLPCSHRKINILKIQKIFFVKTAQFLPKFGSNAEAATSNKRRLFFSVELSSINFIDASVKWQNVWPIDTTTGIPKHTSSFLLGVTTAMKFVPVFEIYLGYGETFAPMQVHCF